MKLIIAEKPSLGRAIADGLKMPFKKAHGGNALSTPSGDYVITWVFGHIIELVEPAAYDERWQKWSLDTLPIIVKDWRYQPRKDAKAQLDLIDNLLRQADCVIHAGDPDREGQLLIEEVLEFLGWQGKTERVMINAYDEKSVQKAFKAIEPNSNYKPLYDAALQRQRADWLVGMNMTRGVTLGLSEGALVSIGRVQTPTLALIYNRDKAIEKFKPTPIYRVQAHMDCGITLDLQRKADDPITVRSVANEIAAQVKGNQYQLQAKTERKKSRPPLPYDLKAFQKDAEKVMGVTAQKALDLLQSLYEKKLVSYPRTECRYLPKDQMPDALPIAEALAPLVLGPERQELVGLMKPAPYVYNDAKVGAHHGIVPLGNRPNGISDQEYRAFELVTLQFMRGLLPAYEYDETKVWFREGEHVFGTTLNKPINKDQSWRALDWRASDDKGEVTPEPELPPGFMPGMASVCTDTTIKTGSTTPPTPYTESSLIEDMASIAKYVTDEKVKAKLKETSGIGTSATRAAILETLKKRGFIETFRKGKKTHLRCTQMGREVIEAIPQTLTKPDVTAAWEEALNMIAEGKYDPVQFEQRIELFINRLLQQINHLATTSRNRVRTVPPKQKAPKGGRKKTGTQARRKKIA